MQDAVANKRCRRRARKTSRQHRGVRRLAHRDDKFSERAALWDLEPDLDQVFKSSRCEYKKVRMGLALSFAVNPFNLLEERSLDNSDEVPPSASILPSSIRRPSNDLQSHVQYRAPPSRALTPFRPFETSYQQLRDTAYEYGPYKPPFQSTCSSGDQSSINSKAAQFEHQELQRMIPSSASYMEAVQLLGLADQHALTHIPTTFAYRDCLIQPPTAAQLLDNMLYRKHSRFFPQHPVGTMHTYQPSSAASETGFAWQYDHYRSQTPAICWPETQKLPMQDVSCGSEPVNTASLHSNASNLWAILASPNPHLVCAKPFSASVADSGCVLDDHTTDQVTSAPAELEGFEIIGDRQAGTRQYIANPPDQLVVNKDTPSTDSLQTQDNHVVINDASADSMNEMMVCAGDPILSASELFVAALATALPDSRAVSPAPTSDLGADMTSPTAAIECTEHEAQALLQCSDSNLCGWLTPQSPNVECHDWDIVTRCDEVEEAYLDWHGSETEDEMWSDDWFVCTSKTDEDDGIVW